MNKNYESNRSHRVAHRSLYYGSQGHLNNHRLINVILQVGWPGVGELLLAPAAYL